MLMIAAVSACTGDDGGGGGGGGGGSGPCVLATAGTGATTWSFDGAPACLIPFGPDSGIDMSFLPLAGELERFEVSVDDVREGETGTFPATVTAKLRGGASYRTGATCTVTISEHVATGESDSFSRTFQTSGDGACTSAATEVGGAGTVTIEPFEFRFPAHW
jgi:hypothetical protein